MYLIEKCQLKVICYKAYRLH